MGSDRKRVEPIITVNKMGRVSIGIANPPTHLDKQVTRVVLICLKHDPLVTSLFLSNYENAPGLFSLCSKRLRVF